MTREGVLQHPTGSTQVSRSSWGRSACTAAVLGGSPQQLLVSGEGNQHDRKLVLSCPWATGVPS